MKIRRALISFTLITLFYLLSLIWVDSKNQIFSGSSKILSILPTLISISLLSYFIRYFRWYWLLSRAGHKTGLFSGFLAYLAGFAFTATPGKLGELIRIRYLSSQGVPPFKVISAFVYERAFDLIVVLFLSALAISQSDIFFIALGFVVFLLIVLILVAFNPRWLTKLSAYFRLYRLKKLARICVTIRDGVSGCFIWITPLDIIVSASLGLLAWGCTAFSFVILLNYLGVFIPFISAMAIYPLAMLAGAASMLPGGVGSTEATIVVLLSMFSAPLATAALVAIGIRISTMWFAVLSGLCTLSVLEYFLHRTDAPVFQKHRD